MTTRERAACAAALRELFALIGRVRVGADDRGRVVPQLSSADLWRTLPRLIGKACDAAESLAAADDRVRIDTEYYRDIAAVIDGRKGKVVA